MSDYTTDTNAAQPDRLGCWARGWGSPKSTKGLKRTHELWMQPGDLTH